MKKFLTIICSTLLVSAAVIYGESGTERYNSEKNMHAVRSISMLEGVCEVAVLSRGDGVLAGILLDKKELGETIYNEAIKIISESFPEAEKIVLEIETDKALDIIELSYYIGTDLKDAVLVQRFNYLLSVQACEKSRLTKNAYYDIIHNKN